MNFLSIQNVYIFTPYISDYMSSPLEPPLFNYSNNAMITVYLTKILII